MHKRNEVNYIVYNMDTKKIVHASEFQDAESRAKEKEDDNNGCINLTHPFHNRDTVREIDRVNNTNYYREKEPDLSLTCPECGVEQTPQEYAQESHKCIKT